MAERKTFSISKNGDERFFGDGAASSSRWRRLGLTFVVGVLAAAALPPVHAVFVLLISIPVLLRLFDRCTTAGQFFWTGWFFGFGRGVAGFYWIAHALLIAPDRFGWMVPFAVGGLAAYVALFAGLVGLGLRFIPLSGWRRLVVFSALWVMAEWIQSWLFTGFPWNFMGTVWTAFPPMIQLASVGGVYLLSLMTLLLAGVPYLWATASTGKKRNAILFSGFLALALLWGGGALRLHQAVQDTVPDVTLRLVQPNIPQTLKWDPVEKERNLQRLIELSASPTAGMPPSHVLWPETAVPYFLEEDVLRLRQVMQAIPPQGLLLTGIVRRTPPEAETFQVWNSLQAFDDYGILRGFYDKAHLVPFGEYVPFRSVLPLEKITPGGTDFSAGPGPRTLELPGLPPTGPLICYEVIFPGEVVNPRNRPDWLLNVTNDGWYGISSGPYQHMASAQLRSVEEGLPLIRVANTGISAVVDSYGQMLKFLSLGEEGFIDSPLPVKADHVTLYSILGNKSSLIFCLMLVGIAIWREQKAKKSFLS